MPKILVVRDLNDSCPLICQKNGIPFSPSNLRIFVDDELDRPQCLKSMDPADGSLFNLILIPKIYFERDEVWIFSFLHELCHSWIPIEYPSDDEHRIAIELLVDLITICTFKELVPTHKRIYRDIIKQITCFGKPETIERVGKSFKQRVFKDPDSCLNEFWGKIRKNL